MIIFRGFILLIVITAVLTFTGCVSTYNSPPSVVHSDNYTAQTDEDHIKYPPGETILTLENAVEIALTNNPGYKSMQYAVTAAWASYYNSLAAFSPSVSFTGGVSGSFSDRASSSAVWRAGLNAEWLVFNGLKREMDVLIASAGTISAEELLKNARRILIETITLKFNDILLNRANVQIQMANEEFWEDMVYDVSVKYKAGAATRGDLLNNEILRNDARANVITETTKYRVNRYALAALMGLSTVDLPVDTKFPDLEVNFNDEFTLSVDFYLDLAIQNRPDLKSYQQVLNQSRYTMYKSWGDFSPTLSLNGGYNFYNESVANPMTYGAGLNWSLWEGGARIFNVREAQANYASQEETYYAQWITIVEEVRTNYINLIASITKREIYDSTILLAEERRNLVLEDYQAGSADIAVFNQAQQQFVGNQGEYVSAIISAANDKARLLSACGINDYVYLMNSL